MSMATASILALLPWSRFQKGFKALAPLPSPTKTTKKRARPMITKAEQKQRLEQVKANRAQPLDARQWASMCSPFGRELAQMCARGNESEHLRPGDPGCARSATSPPPAS